MGRWAHHHHCDEPDCRTAVHCTAPPVVDEDGRAECWAAGRKDFLCEDHHDLPTCAWCGRREPTVMVIVDGDRMHAACAAEMIHAACASEQAAAVIQTDSMRRRRAASAR